METHPGAMYGSIYSHNANPGAIDSFWSRGGCPRSHRGFVMSLHAYSSKSRIQFFIFYSLYFKLIATLYSKCWDEPVRGICPYKKVLYSKQLKFKNCSLWTTHLIFKNRFNKNLSCLVGWRAICEGTYAFWAQIYGFSPVLLSIYAGRGKFDNQISPHPCKRGGDLYVHIKKSTLENQYAKLYKYNVFQCHTCVTYLILI
jgi:hypothetical protein